MAGPLYEHLASQLDSKRAELTEPLRLPSEPEMADEYQLSRDTVRRALQLLERRGAVTRRRRRGTYLRPLVAPSENLSGKTVGLVPPWWADSTGEWFTSIFFEGISRWAEAHGCAISVLHTEPKPSEVDRWVDQVQQRKLAGLIWIHPQTPQMLLVERCAKVVPTVIAGRYYPGRNLHHVSPDFGLAAKLIDRHLAAYGHTQYAVFGRSALEDYTRVWIEAFAAAQSERGAAFDYRQHFVDFHNLAKARMAELLLDFYHPKYPDVKAFVLLSSGFLPYLLANARFREIVSREWSLVAFDYGAQPIESYWPGHAITHVACDWSRIGQRAIAMLKVLAAGGELPEVLLEPVHLQSPDSTRPYASPKA